MTAFLAVDIAEEIVVVWVLISPSILVIAAIIELRLAAAREGVVVKLDLRIPDGIAAYACCCSQFNVIAPPFFSTKSISPVTSAAVLVPGKLAVPIKSAIAEPRSTILISI